MSVSSRGDVLSRVRAVLASECSCDVADFDLDAVVINEMTHSDRGRRYFHRSDPFLVTMGRGVAIGASATHLDWVRDNLGNMSRDDIFSARSIAALVDYLKPHKKELYGPDLKYVCSVEDVINESNGHNVELLVGDDVFALYESPGFPNALQYRRDHPQPDVLATVVYLSGVPVAVAGASADCDDMWQIGIDVLPEHRSSGYGRALVSRLTTAILERGRVPYYSTSPSNIGSRRLARSVGFWPAWTELRTWNHR